MFHWMTWVVPSSQIIGLDVVLLGLVKTVLLLLGEIAETRESRKRMTRMIGTTIPDARMRERGHMKTMRGQFENNLEYSALAMKMAGRKQAIRLDGETA